MVRVLSRIPDECPYCGKDWPMDSDDPRLVKNGGDMLAFVRLVNDEPNENDSPAHIWNTSWACRCFGGCGRPFVVVLQLSPIFNTDYRHAYERSPERGAA